MKTSSLAFILGAGLAGVAPYGQAEVAAAPVEYVRVCSLYGAGFHYLPGSDICVNASTGDARVQTEGGVWRSLLPYPEGRWVTSPSLDCANGRVANLGTFTSTDFTVNAWQRLQTPAVPLRLSRGEFVSRVIMSGGFYDPRIPNAHGANGIDGLCVRSVDPSALEALPGGGRVNPPFGNGMLPVGCIANSRIVNMPAAYSIAATSAHPSVDSYFLDAEQTDVAGPYNYGSRLTVTTDMGRFGPYALSYYEATSGRWRHMAGRLSVSVCIDQGAPTTFGR